MPFCFGDIGHRGKVVFDHLLRRGAGVSRDVVGARQNDNCGRMKVDYILLEAHQHLRRGLPADAPVHVRLAREKHSRRHCSAPRRR